MISFNHLLNYLIEFQKDADSFADCPIDWDNVPVEVMYQPSWPLLSNLAGVTDSHELLEYDFNNDIAKENIEDTEEERKGYEAAKLEKPMIVYLVAGDGAPEGLNSSNSPYGDRHAWDVVNETGADPMDISGKPVVCIVVNATYTDRFDITPEILPDNADENYVLSFIESDIRDISPEDFDYEVIYVGDKNEPLVTKDSSLEHLKLWLAWQDKDFVDDDEAEAMGMGPLELPDAIEMCERLGAFMTYEERDKL